jgi:hypothetical protein
MDKAFITERVAAITEREVKADSSRVTPNRASALRLARRLGCEGAHQLPDGSWAPCPAPDALQATITGGAKGYQQWKTTKGKDLNMPSRLDYQVKNFQNGMMRRAAAMAMMQHEGHDEADEYGGPRFSNRQNTQIDDYVSIVTEYGQFDAGVGPDGAHYVEKSPFANEGLICANCAFYEGPRGCHIVAGNIAPDAICKLWVIPQDLIAGED